MNLNPWQLALGVAAVPLALAYVCRLAGMSWRTARPGPVAFHFLGLCFCGSVIFLQPVGAAIVVYALGLAFAGAWLAISYTTWRSGPPAHVRSKPMPLDETPRRLTPLTRQKGR